MRKLLLVPLSLAALALGASMLPAAAADTEGQATATKRVRVGDFFFRKKSLTIQRGDQVRWIWVGQESHDVFVTRGPRKFHSRRKRSGRYRQQFFKRGTYRYICTVHPIQMRAKIVVE
jgi:plastocyanin